MRRYHHNLIILLLTLLTLVFLFFFFFFKQKTAYEILEKPLDTDRILVMLRNALSHMDLQEENARLKQSIDAPFEIVGKTPVMRALMEKVEKVATPPPRVLITG